MTKHVLNKSLSAGFDFDVRVGESGLMHEPTVASLEFEQKSERKIWRQRFLERIDCLEPWSRWRRRSSRATATPWKSMSFATTRGR